MEKQDKLYGPLILKRPTMIMRGCKLQKPFYFFFGKSGTTAVEVDNKRERVAGCNGEMGVRVNEQKLRCLKVPQPWRKKAEKCLIFRGDPESETTNF